MIRIAKIIPPALVCLTASLVSAHTSYTGRSGAPGQMTCASSCHGNSGGSIAVTGFPRPYTPGTTYTIRIGHDMNGAIRQFNGSVRVGTGSVNAGVIAAGTNTATYNATGETNGVHFSTASQDTGTFLWTAPAAGTGSVKLYVSGLQGTNKDGLNSSVELTAQEAVTTVAMFPAGAPLFRDEPSSLLLQGGQGASLSQVFFLNTRGQILPAQVSAAGDGLRISKPVVPGMYILQVKTGENRLHTLRVVRD